MSESTTTPAPDTTPAGDTKPPEGKAPDKTPEGGAPDLAAVVAALTQKLDGLTAELTAEKTKAAEAAEAARVAKLSDAEKLAEERKALDLEKKGLVQEARKSAADKLGINAKALPLVPDVDPRTAEGAKAMEAWAKENPEFCKTTTAAPNPLTALGQSAKGKLADILSGKTSNPLITADSLKKMYGG